MRFVGAHLSSSGGLENALKTADKFGVNSVQAMPSAPMRWSAKDIPDEMIERLNETIKTTNVRKYLVHGIYLINLARGDKQMFHLSKLSLVTYLNFVKKVEDFAKINNPNFDVLGVTFHPGSAKDLSLEESIKRIHYGLNWSLEESQGGELLLETSAGAGNVLGDTLEELAQMRDGVEQKDRVKYVLDTQHMFVSGYDWINNLDGVVKNIEDILGLGNVKAFHLNDSMTDFNSHKDRHANLGEGKIGKDAIIRILNHPKLKNIPFILETPGLKDDSGILGEVDKLKEWAQE